MRRIVDFLPPGAGLLLAILAGNVFAEPAVFTVHDPEGRNVVLFESRAPLEMVYGTAHRVSGRVVLDRGLPANSRATFTVPLDSLDTGILLRNTQMRTQYLETDRFPDVVFTLVRVDRCVPPVIEAGVPCKIEGVGRFDLHGISHEQSFAAEVTYLEESSATRSKLPGNLLRLVAEAELRLGDYGIPVPQLVALKLDENIKVRIDVTATDSVGAEATGTDTDH